MRKFNNLEGYFMKNKEIDQKALNQEKVSHSHDLAFKRLLFKIVILKEILKLILPKPLLSILKLSTLRIEKIDRVEQKESRSDFAVTINFKDPAYKAKILFFFEHFSHLVSGGMFNLLKYQSSFYSKKEDHLVLSIVVSQGVSGQKWKAPITFQEELQARGALPYKYLGVLADYVMNFKAFLWDLQTTDISQVTSILKPIVYAFKYIHSLHRDQPQERRNEFLKHFYRIF